jgi:hypothetical protein
MAAAESIAQPAEQQVDKGLKSGALGLVSTTIIATASVAPAIAFYYGLTGFACTWYYRRNVTSSARNLWMQGIIPSLGGLILFFLGGWSVCWTTTWPPRTTTRCGPCRASTGRSAGHS